MDLAVTLSLVREWMHPWIHPGSGSRFHSWICPYIRARLHSHRTSTLPPLRPAEFSPTADDLKDVDSAVRFYLRVVEAFKFAFAQRSRLGDADFMTDLPGVRAIPRLASTCPRNNSKNTDFCDVHRLRKGSPTLQKWFL